MDGFFDIQEAKSDVRPNGKTLNCQQCQLFKHKRLENPKLSEQGQFKKKILIIGEFTSKREDATGKYFRDKEGKYLKQELSKVGISVERDCLIVNAVRCATIRKKPVPTNNEIDCCRIKLIKTIKQHLPSVILLLGSVSLQSLIGYRFAKGLGSINKWRGFVIPDQDFNCWIAPVFAPSYVLAKDKPEVTMVWKRDLENFANYTNKECPVIKKPKVKIITDLTKLNKLKNVDRIAFDYETTGLKPHAKGHKIVCAGVAASSKLAYSFMIPKKKKKLLPFLNLLTNKVIKKMAHNMKYEDNWTLVIFGIRVRNWFLDSQLFAHILDNRSRITSLKFQTYIRFGVSDYSSEVQPYLEAKDSKNANSMNTLLDYVKKPKNAEKVLIYCGYDSAYQFALAEEQERESEELQLPF